MPGILQLVARDQLDWPDAGNGKNETVLGGVLFPLSTLDHFNYTYYSNGTMSNGSNCYLTFKPYQPAELFPNGTFLNGTSCYHAVDNISTRGYVGIGFAVAYGITLVLTVTVLTKHGKQYLPKTKRFFPIGRRWQWYWACFVCACALISLFINVDVDRYRVQELPIVVTCFFWFLLCQGTTALVWESVRHWGSWQERQFVDPNPFALRIDDRRSKVEFWLPIWFYFWTWLNFFLVVPRNWSFVEKQRSPEQTAAIAVPSALSARFKAGAFCLVISWLTILFSLRHSILHYKPRNRGLVNKSVGLVQSVPLRFMFTIPLLGGLIAYQIFMSFNWELSLLRFHGVVPVQFGWGFGPSLVIMLIQVIYGYINPNEDKDLIRQRRERGEVIDRELGLVKKPAWWRRVRGEHEELSFRERIFRNVKEVGGERGIGRREENEMERHIRQEALRMAVDDGIELPNMPRRESANPREDRAGVRDIMNSQSNPDTTPLPRYEGKSQRRHTERVMQSAAGVLFPNNEADAARARREAELFEDGPPPAYTGPDRGRHASERPESAHRENSTSTTNSVSAPPQQVRSMLDV
ncbi:conserved fungal protein [Cordyceps javanica]|uniref:Conserved fungal protein n=1 Tax=Cordyceps javanica TaxID=43265 RepID=A0A545W6F9_9HYPO|nr:conserved fungal protein [Cordyceps javanica]TQW09573.1 conserved fungal protein [Cordyceps javanica]